MRCYERPGFAGRSRIRRLDTGQFAYLLQAHQCQCAFEGVLTFCHYGCSGVYTVEDDETWSGMLIHILRLALTASKCSNASICALSISLKSYC
jgi:hypothetical protein